jgi:predicted dehydrogenase
MAKAQASARQYDIPLAFDSAEKLCRSPQVDAVFVATPNAYHLQDVLVAAACGKPVLCEKPMAVNAIESRQMVDVTRKANVLLGIAQVFRFDESTAWFREQAAAGSIGQVVFARSEFSFSVDRTHPRSWINDPAVAGGGPVADVGVHCIDALRFVLQDEVRRVSAREIAGNPGNVEAGAALLLEFSRGTLATVMVSFRGEYRTPLELVGETGVIRADNALNVEHPVEIELRRGGVVAKKATVSNRLAYALQVDAFADAVEGKTEFPIPGVEGWRNQEILDASYRSMKSKKTEEVRNVY